jgi:hypothetical protein
MNRRQFIVALALSPAIAITIAEADTPGGCPVCGGKLVLAGSMADDESRPSVNLELWDRSSHGAFWPFYNETSRICSRCYLAYKTDFGLWARASEIAGSFYYPLSERIFRFPLQDRIGGLRTVYYQSFKGVDASGMIEESVAYWARDSKAFRGSVQAYADSNSLIVEFYTAKRLPGQVHVTATFARPPRANSRAGD